MEDFSLEDLQAALQSAQEEKSAVSERNLPFMLRVQFSCRCDATPMVIADQAVGQEHSRASQQAATMRIAW